MITVQLNGISCTIEKNCTLINLLAQHGYTTGHYAVMLNKFFVPSINHKNTFLSENDVIETMTPMQGG